jgi:hypothetical protein
MYTRAEIENPCCSSHLPDSRRYGALHPALPCTVSSATNKGDGVTGFHWLTADDSEYMTIRHQQEPIPAP